MHAALAMVVRSVLVLSLLLSGAPRALAAGAPSGDAQLVMLAEPQPPASVATSKGAVTLPYRVVEVFSGEPGSASVVVRHPQLDPMDRQRLASGERVIVMAKPDAENPGRWVGSAPLRATDEAIAAFRKWGAPADVRRETPLSEAVAVAKRSEGDVSRPVEREASPEPSIAPTPAPAPKAAPAPDPVEDESVGGTPSWHEVPAAADEPEPEPEPTRAPVAPPTPLPVEPADDAADEAPLTFDDEDGSESSLVPGHGPGLPGAPTPRILGPSLSRRSDLKTESDD